MYFNRLPHSATFRYFLPHSATFGRYFLCGVLFTNTSRAHVAVQAPHRDIRVDISYDTEKWQFLIKVAVLHWYSMLKVFVGLTLRVF